MGLTSLSSLRNGISLAGEVEDLRGRRDRGLGWLQDGISFGRAGGGERVAKVFPVRVFAGDGERLPFFDLLAERLALGGQVLDPFGHLANVLVRGKDQTLALRIADGLGF